MILSPLSINGGTWIFIPLSKVAGLYDEETVCPLRATSVVSIIQVTCTIDTTDVALKGQTVSSSYKPATLDNGINIQVPPFIESGDKIIVDTRTMEYIKKI